MKFFFHIFRLIRGVKKRILHIILLLIIVMNRKEFLAQLGLGAAFVLTATCLGGCSSDQIASPSNAVDFTLDLNDAANNALTTNGGFLIKNKVVVARTNTGEYVAATQVCSHEGNVAVLFSNNEFACTVHGARFDLKGNGLNAFGSKDLTVYKTSLNGSTLRVFA
jgi:nitrite reductase/ring-hydroxylating ferredoxin subunit